MVAIQSPGVHQATRCHRRDLNLPDRGQEVALVVTGRAEQDGVVDRTAIDRRHRVADVEGRQSVLIVGVPDREVAATADLPVDPLVDRAVQRTPQAAQVSHCSGFLDSCIDHEHTFCGCKVVDHHEPAARAQGFAVGCGDTDASAAADRLTAGNEVFGGQWCGRHTCGQSVEIQERKIGIHALAEDIDLQFDGGFRKIDVELAMARIAGDHDIIVPSRKDCSLLHRSIRRAQHRDRGDAKIGEFIRARGQSDRTDPALIAQHLRLVPVDRQAQRATVVHAGAE